MHVYEAVARSLAERGVQVVFGLAGDANLMLLENYVRIYGGTYVSSAHEAGAVLMANGYASTSGRVGVATVTHGPAVTNTITALVEGVRNHSPLVLIAGATPAEDRENLQFADQSSLFWGTGVGFEQVRSELTVLDDLDVAFRRAILERRPVVVNLPVELVERQIEYRAPSANIQSHGPSVPSRAALEEAASVLASANRPLILAGRGAITDGARDAVVALAKRLGAPVATTLKGKNLFNDEPANLGIFGTLSHDTALSFISESDCVVAFGASLNKWTTVTGSLLNGKRVVQVDSSASAIGRFSDVHVGLVGDAGDTADALLHMLDDLDAKPSTYRSRAEELIAQLQPPAFEDLSTNDTVDLRAALAALDESMPSDRILATDGGQFIFELLKMVQVEHPQRFVLGVNFGSIGLGMGNAIGASYGIPGSPVLMVCGDGGFMLGGLTEFNTAVRHGVDLVVALFNNSCYGPEYVHLEHEGLDPAFSTFQWPDFAEVARALGGDGVVVRNAQDLQAVPAAIKNRTRPLLIEFRTDPALTSDEREQSR